MVRAAAKPALLDLFCGAGGAAMGYARAGFSVVGVDNRPQPRYPFPFIQMDALEFVERYARRMRFQAIHASPPCQAHTVLKFLSTVAAANHPDLVDATRQRLRATRLPYVIENVPGAPLFQPITLCGSQFEPAMKIRRHRLFESSVALTTPRPCRHHLFQPVFEPNRSDKRKNPDARASVIVVAGHDSRGGNGGVAMWRTVMGIEWMTRNELAQAIPPAYTEHIGKCLLRALR